VRSAKAIGGSSRTPADEGLDTGSPDYNGRL